MRRATATRRDVLRVGRFLLVGGGATAMQYVLLVILVEFGDWRAVPASTLGFACGALFSYVANYRWTFRSSRSHRAALARFVAMAGFGLALNAALMWLLHNPAGLHYVASQMLATGIGLVVNYLLASRWVYVAPADGDDAARARPHG